MTGEIEPRWPADRTPRRIRLSGFAAGAWRIVRRALSWVFVTLCRYLDRFYVAAGALLAVGLVLALTALWGLASLTEEVLEGDTVRVDSRIMLCFDAHATPSLDRIALDATALGSTVVVVTLAIVAGLLLWLLGRAAYAAMIASAVGGAMVITPVLKTLFARPRPRLFEWRVDYAGLASYPSGHATMAAIFFVVLAYVIHRLAGPRRWLSVSVLGTGAAMALIVGLSRIYLGVHYPTDVLAGYAVGFAWTVFCILVVEILSVRNAGRRPPPAPEARIRHDHRLEPPND